MDPTVKDIIKYSNKSPDNLEQRITSMLEDVLKGDSSDDDLKNNNNSNKNGHYKKDNFKPMICLNDIPVTEDMYVIECNEIPCRKNNNTKKPVKKSNTLDINVNSSKENFFNPSKNLNMNLNFGNNLNFNTGNYNIGNLSPTLEARKGNYLPLTNINENIDKNIVIPSSNNINPFLNIGNGMNLQMNLAKKNLTTKIPILHQKGFENNLVIKNINIGPRKITAFREEIKNGIGKIIKNEYFFKKILKKILKYLLDFFFQ